MVINTCSSRLGLSAVGAMNPCLCWRFIGQQAVKFHQQTRLPTANLDHRAERWAHETIMRFHIFSGNVDKEH